MQIRMIAMTGVAAAWLASCGQANPGASLTISPSGTAGSVQITGPTEFTAELVNSTADVSWSLTGGGTLSSTSGLHIIYTPPLGSSTASLTAGTAGLTATVQIAASPASITGATVPGLTAPVSVQYDAEDIPHVVCAQIIDCIAVQGYLHARDRLFPMDFLRHVARSKLSQLIGVQGLAQDEQLRTLFITRAGNRLEDDLTMALDDNTAALMQAYAGGVNAYLAELRAHPELPLPGEYAQLPFPITAADIDDWQVQDTLALGRLEQFQLSETIEEESAYGLFAATYAKGPLKDLGKMNAWIRAASPTTEQAHTLAPAGFQSAVVQADSRSPTRDLSGWHDSLAKTTAAAAALRAFLRPSGAAVGSNNWVVSAAKSATHVSMVANDPHLSLQYPPLFHLATLTSTNPSDNLELAGGAFPGIPGALVGRGAHVGWGVTVVGYDVTDLYMEQFLPQEDCPTPVPCVMFNKTPTPTIPVSETYLVRVGPGAAGLVDVTTLNLPNPPSPVVLVVPQHGPIIQAPDDNGQAISARWTGQEGNTRDTKAILGLNTATDIHSAIAALTDFATGAQNFVLADDQGHIAYDPHALVPVRSFADGVALGNNAIPPWFPLPGDGSAEWGDGVSDCAAATLIPVPASCWIANDVLPHGEDPAKGYFFTANADPTFPSTTDDNNPLAHPPYLSFHWDDSSGFRATRIDQRLGDTIAANGSVSLADMESIQADHVSRPGMVFTAYIADLPTDANSPPELIGAKAVLAAWAAAGWDCPSGLTGSDPKISAIDSTPAVVTNSAGCFLFHDFVRTLLTNVFTDDLAVVGQGVDGLSAIKAMIFMLSLDPDSAEGQANSTFCNDVDATGTLVAAHTCAEQVVTALVQSYDQLSSQVSTNPNNWVWGRVHTIQPVSLLQLVTNDYEPGPYARPGGAFTVDVGSPSMSGGGLAFGYTSGGNVRHISLMDPTAPVVKMQLPGPERDGPTVFVGPDLLGQWVANHYFDFAFGTQINSAAVSTQAFTAQ